MRADRRRLRIFYFLFYDYILLYIALKKTLCFFRLVVPTTIIVILKYIISLSKSPVMSRIKKI